ncbi:flagellar biosynthesis protein FlhA [Pyruvatibacter mobilis]|uniref:Flagellar biosynthesis protein FlhA n=1 Tax=Pyruvatibacter mobilis TaxID=1712261 RepID=A0A845QE48_9HYPH|nr:flagellar biosynthesis protein FlhA [Pyruvatibacter mobilis]NBG96664.1 flagellar biosynthesis protein FlhA [Pyruvatibacter mobilis]QJD74334.1 flagellar biosynthesis protein FlhA [Pyruvatibacter mobilis]GGD06001.1 flagellar biosynthesis protein FlhA [Pyruvatibacter mobilis]
MSDASQTSEAPAAGGGLFAGLSLNSIGAAIGARSELALALGVMTIIVVLILPMPSWMLDFALAISITFSVLVMMTALFIRKPLEFSSFPTVLLIATMLRLALNLASTRLILSDGHEGTHAAGAVIEAFGNFVMQGNFVIGIIVFAILVIVNFVVITKGSGRIAEVAARFSLDAMPGKQMAIDADLSAGLIDEETARNRRAELEAESAFYGSMDGASKFVRGDAIAGLLITFINVIAGVIVGVAQMEMSFADASTTYTLLTVGDGLVSQIPALIVSTAAGLLVSKAGVDGAADEALFGQLSGYPQALGMSSGVMVVMAMLPGIPMIPFLLLGGLSGGAAWYLTRDAQKKVEEQEAIEAAAAAEEAAAPPAEEPISTALAMDELRLELGFGLLPLLEGDGEGHTLTEQVKALRRQIAQDMGFVMPSLRILDNMQLESTAYVVRVKEVEAGAGELYPGKFMVMDPMGAPVDLPGEHTTEPTFGLPATWVDQTQREEAAFRGLTVVDPATVLTTHITEIIKSHMAELLSYGEVQKLLDDIGDANKKLVEDLVPDRVSVTTVQRVLQQLLTERVSIRDLPTILEAIGEAVGYTQSITQIVEHVRTRLARQICHAHQSYAGYLPLVALSPQWEDAFANALIGNGEDKQLAMPPSDLQDFIQALRMAFDQAAASGDVPVLLVSPGNRPYVRSVVERVRPQTVVMSQAEVHPQARLKTLAQI